MFRESRINPLTAEPERGARFCRGAIVIRLSSGEVEAVNFAADRGYLPATIGHVRHREDGSGSWRIRREDAYEWAEWAAEDPDAFCACLSRRLCRVFAAADFRIRDSWAV
jgi:hypothetical protein